jgi:hypothetical protein
MNGKLINVSFLSADDVVQIVNNIFDADEKAGLMGNFTSDGNTLALIIHCLICPLESCRLLVDTFWFVHCVEIHGSTSSLEQDQLLHSLGTHFADFIMNVKNSKTETFKVLFCGSERC